MRGKNTKQIIIILFTLINLVNLDTSQSEPKNAINCHLRDAG